MPPRSVRRLPLNEMEKLSVERLNAYRKKLLTLEQSMSLSDRKPEQLAQMDPSHLHFKEDPAWQQTLQDVLTVLDRKARARPSADSSS